ncbi:MAG: threonylcarbamoyl-AMP synthase [Phycisphaerales bacterium]|nr:threonylcarbamoyl-AMP synthase [Phycisphaerales bacterium]
MPSIVDPSIAACHEAARRLLRGMIVALPTETVYGLAARTFDPAALERIYSLKGRPADNPLIAHVLDAEHARRLTTIWTERAQQLADAFWPGPLTIILPRHPDVPAAAAGGRSTIAIRAPRHEVFRAVLARTGEPLSAPSANRSGHVSPTRAQHVADDFADDADLLILDGGASVYGIESTVVDLTSDPPVVLRPGAITLEQLRAVVPTIITQRHDAQIHSPGTSDRHYAPRTPARCVPRNTVVDELAQSTGRAVVLSIGALEIPALHVSMVMPIDAEHYAHELYDALRAADAHHADEIVIEEPPDDAAWHAVRDRIRRACA